MSNFDFGLSNPLLDPLGIKSDSTIYNLSSLFCLTVIWALPHLIIFILFRFWSRSQFNENTSWWTKFVRWLIIKTYKFLTFGFYIRTCLEMNQLMVISSANEIHQFNVLGALRIISLVAAFLVLIFCLSLIIISMYLTCSLYKIVENQHNKIEEFFIGLKINKKDRLFSSALLFKRVLYISILLVFDTTSPNVLVILVTVLQFVYSCYLVILRPFHEVKSNIIEILNEIYVFVLFVTLIFLNTKEDWNSAKTSTYVWMISSNSIIIFLIILSKNKANNFIVDTFLMLFKKWKKK